MTLTKEAKAKESQWYALRVRGRREEKVKKEIQEVFAKTEKSHILGDIYAPFRRAYAMYKGKQTLRKSFLGYLFLQLSLSQEPPEENRRVWECLLEIPDVMGFVVEGQGYARKGEATPISSREIERMVGKENESTQTKESVATEIQQGQLAEITQGAFKGREVIVQAVHSHSKEVDVVLRIFNQETTVTLSYHQIKIK